MHKYREKHTSTYLGSGQVVRSPKLPPVAAHVSFDGEATCMGTPGYASPTLATRDTSLTPAADARGSGHTENTNSIGDPALTNDVVVD